MVPAVLLGLHFGHRFSHNRAKFLPVSCSQWVYCFLYGKGWLLSCTDQGATHIELGDVGTQHVG